MDEIDWFKQFRKGFLGISIFFFGLGIFYIICGLINYQLNLNEVELRNIIKTGITIIVSCNFFLAITYGVVWIISKLTNIKIDINFNKEYIRELQKEYTPALVSLMYDFKTEVYRDYTSTILFLNLKKYINISGFNDDITITKGENENLSNLAKHELYVYDCVTNNQRFEQDIFKNFIFEDAKEKGLIIENDIKDLEIKKQSEISGFGIVISMILLVISKSKILTVFMNVLLGISIIYGVILPIIQLYRKNLENNYELTKKGKQELKKIKAFRNFIKEYTLIKEKDIEHIQLLEEYIPYSLSLGTSPQVEEYIKQNEIYRNLIYKGRENWI